MQWVYHDSCVFAYAGSIILHLYYRIRCCNRLSTDLISLCSGFLGIRWLHTALLFALLFTLHEKLPQQLHGSPSVRNAVLHFQRQLCIRLLKPVWLENWVPPKVVGATGWYNFPLGKVVM